MFENGVVTIKTIEAENAVKKMIAKYQQIQDISVRERELSRAHHWLNAIKLHTRDEIQLSMDSIILANVVIHQEKKDFLAESN
jgi:hypothetical protein